MPEEIPSTQFALLLQGALASQNVSLNELAKAMGPSYEYFRRILRGTAVPTDPLIRMLSEYFGWKYDDVQKMAVQDRMRRKFGKLGIVAQGRNPEVEQFELSWPYLGEVQKEDLLMRLKNFLTANRKAGIEFPAPAISGYTEFASSRKKKVKRG